MTKKSQGKHRNKIEGKTSKLIRWDDELLEKTQERAKTLGMPWSTFIQNAARSALENETNNEL
ncbi:hypothetical protein AB4176_00395 [Vibrio splendidus]|jgi:predicted DNA binding CopG/RHH family protein|uniref:hypothetical protein n=1 Tax=Vibrio sp. 10N.286.49.E1 TaxID=3229702 RepID=UPI003551CE85